MLNVNILSFVKLFEMLKFLPFFVVLAMEMRLGSLPMEPGWRAMQLRGPTVATDRLRGHFPKLIFDFCLTLAEESSFLQLICFLFVSWSSLGCQYLIDPAFFAFFLRLVSSNRGLMSTADIF